MATHTIRLINSLINNLCHHLFTNSRFLRQTTLHMVIRLPLHISRPLSLCTPAHRHSIGTIHTAHFNRPFNIPRARHIHQSRFPTATNPLQKPQSLSLRRTIHNPTGLIASKPKVPIGIIRVYHREATSILTTRKRHRACKDTTVIRMLPYTLRKEVPRASATLELTITQQQFLTLTSVMQAILLCRCPFMI